MTTETKTDIPTKAKTPYDWSGLEDDCPEDIVVLTGIRPLILQAEAHPTVRADSPRIERGDRRQGAYYIEKVLRAEIGSGLQRLVDVARSNGGPEKVVELEKVRTIRTGDRAPDWVLEARARAASGHDPAQSENVHDAMTRLNIAARNW